MRTAIVILALAWVPTSALAASLPLDDGDYTRGQCNNGSSDYLESFDIQTVSEGPQRGRRFLYPEAEGQEGSCITGTISVSGARFFGAAKCEGGGSRIRYSTGTYRFSLDVLNKRSFMSKGRKYVWCASHR